MSKLHTELCWISKLDEENGIWSVQTRGRQFYTYNEQSEIRHLEDGYAALVRLDNNTNLPRQVSPKLDLPVTLATVQAHFAWVRAEQVPQQVAIWFQVANIKDPVLKEFLVAVLSDSKIMHGFYRGKASQRFHHHGEGELFIHSVEVAITARNIAQGHKLDLRTIDCAFVCGLLHDIGKILMFYNTGKSKENGVNGQHEAFSFMVLAEHLEVLKTRDKILFEAVSATLSVSTSWNKHNEYVVETIVRAADRISAEANQSRMAFKNKPDSHLHVNFQSGKRYKRLGPAQAITA